LTKSAAIPDLVTAGGATVGVRWPSHPFIQAVIRECGFPLAAPSANLSNEISPTSAEHVRKQLGDQLNLIVDGGQSQVGIESTVVDLTARPPHVLRPGMIHEESLGAVLGNIQPPTPNFQPPTLRSPGLLKKHYAPKARLVILNWTNDAGLRRQLENLKSNIANLHVIAHTHIPAGTDWGGVSVIPHDAEAFARALYGELHRCDEAGAELIVVEALPETIEWRAIADRLNRAAS
jgi:L-threonylcarbamoyladenylate synthase